ncbi:cobalamin-dependent protein [Actinoplanes sp. NPDC051851]|uniref:cobalamin B12-binding domain-containing protein n=1 Tax=Actinoplanes sp. NPDC051851 TaxID=3154753 RepID=UPI003427B853
MLTPAQDPAPGLTVLVAGGASDSHTWNLVYLELYLTEAGHRVVNAGPCVTGDLLVTACRRHRPDLVVVSSVNGHGHRDGLAVITALRAHPQLAAVPAVIGGKLGVAGPLDPDAVARLRAAGYTEVYQDGDATALLALLDRLAARPARIEEHVP